MSQDAADMLRDILDEFEHIHSEDVLELPEPRRRLFRARLQAMQEIINGYHADIGWFDTTAKEWQTVVLTMQSVGVTPRQVAQLVGVSLVKARNQMAEADEYDAATAAIRQVRLLINILGGDVNGSEAVPGGER